MAIIMNDQGGRSQLQQRLAAELKQKLAAAGDGDAEKVTQKLQSTPDLVDESAYVKDFQKKSAGANSRVVAIIIASVVILVLFGLMMVLI